jgi:hypothetical protein
MPSYVKETHYIPFHVFSRIFKDQSFPHYQEGVRVRVRVRVRRDKRKSAHK